MALIEGSSFPGENFVKTSTVKMDIFKELAPALQKDQPLQDRINEYVFGDLTNSQRQLLRDEIAKRIQQKSPATSDCQRQLLLTMIDGMEYAKAHFQLHDNNAMDNWLNRKKEEAIVEMDHTAISRLCQEKNHESRLEKNKKRHSGC